MKAAVALGYMAGAAQPAAPGAPGAKEEAKADPKVKKEVNKP